MPRTELESRFQKMQEEFEALRKEMTFNLRQEVRAELDEKTSKILEMSADTYATKQMLQKVESTLSADHTKLKSQTEEQFVGVASTYATKDEIKDHTDRHT